MDNMKIQELKRLAEKAVVAWDWPEFAAKMHDAFTPEAVLELIAIAERASELEAARIAYASEFPLTEDGDPDVGNIHANIRKLKAERATPEGNTEAGTSATGVQLRSIAANKEFERTAKTLHYNWTPADVHKLIDIADQHAEAHGDARAEEARREVESRIKTTKNYVKDMEGSLRQIADAVGVTVEDVDLTIARVKALAAQRTAGGVVSALGIAGIGVKHFGNPIPQAWYAAAKDLQAAILKREPVAEAAAQADDTGARIFDVVADLREYASNPGYSHNDYADTMRKAANTIESLRAGFFNYAGIVADAAPTAQPTPPDDERAAFEQHALDTGWKPGVVNVRHGDDYDEPFLTDAWLHYRAGYKEGSARAALRHPPVPDVGDIDAAVENAKSVYSESCNHTREAIDYLATVLRCRVAALQAKQAGKEPT